MHLKLSQARLILENKEQLLILKYTPQKDKSPTSGSVVSIQPRSEGTPNHHHLRAVW